MTDGIFKNVLACILAASVCAVSLPAYSFVDAISGGTDNAEFSDFESGRKVSGSISR